MRNLFTKIQQQIQTGHHVVLTTIIAGSGSTPRGAGAKMAIFDDGSIYGTIGGGALEYTAQQMARDTLKQQQSFTREFKLAPNQIADLGMVCGGDVELLFQFLAANDPATAQQIDCILAALGKNENSWMITHITTEGNWAQQTIIGNQQQLADWPLPQPLTNATARFFHQDQNYYIEPLQTAGKVYIFGGGHISKALVPVLVPLGFSCIVVDDKLEFLATERFPLAEQRILAPFQDVQSCLSITADDYIVIMTRGHANDYDVLVQALRTPACYIGMIGSRTKLAATREKLLNQGFTEADFQRAHAPIGLPIKAVTPEEIAISIAAQLIQIRAELN